ncbi:MAG: YbaN family protein [Alphaproteobacteria bacterium]|nr:YbaN family protein [Alphaproteobacteria bacterium]MDP6623655.1 YbaN family protein [Alphaproteobacteria bacterium]
MTAAPLPPDDEAAVNAGDTSRVAVRVRNSAALRHALFAFAWLNVVVGVVGIFLPLLPTTVFLLIALWAFSLSSPRFQAWLYHHPRLGPPIRAWHDHGVIPLRAKMAAVVVMSAGLIFLAWKYGDAVLTLGLGILLVIIASWIVTRPARPELPKS